MTTQWDVALPATSEPSVSDYVDLARRAERLGYDRVWLGEGWGRDAVTVLATVARATDSIGIGTSIVPVYSRTPALAGQTAVTLQEASSGRFRLGVGTGGPPIIERWHGVEFDRPLRRLREFIEVVRQVVEGEVVDYDGDVYDLDGFRLRHTPPTPPPAIDAAAIGPKSVELAGRFADGWHAFLFSPSGLEDRSAALERGADLGDRDVEAVRIAAGVPVCALTDGNRARRLAAMGIAQYVGRMGPHYREAIAAQGYESVTDEVVAAWENDDRDRATDLVASDLLEEFAAAGTPDRVRDRLDRFADTPADAVKLQFPAGADLEEVRATMDAVAPE